MKGLEGDHLVAFGDEPLEARMSSILLHQGDVGLLYLVLDTEGPRAVVAAPAMVSLISS